MCQQKGQFQIIFVIILIVIAIVFFSKGFGNGSLPAEKTKVETLQPKPPEEVKTPEQEVSPLPLLPDATPPQRFNPKPTGELPVETRQVTMSLETDERATCRHSTASGVHYEYMEGRFSENSSTLHSVLITTLSEGEEYIYYIRCIDEHGNKNTDDLEISFKVKAPEDKTPPILQNPSHSGDVLPAGTTEVTISISTNEPASCRYDIEQGIPYKSIKKRFSHYDQTKLFHVAAIKNLEDGKSYNYFVRCEDLADNVNTGDVMIYFQVAQP